MKLPKLPSIEIPRPTTWDLIAAALLALGGAVAVVNVVAVGADEAGGSVSSLLTLLFVLGHLGVCLGGLMVLGMTAKLGTIWGNLAAVGACFVGMSGFLLAAALWSIA